MQKQRIGVLIFLVMASHALAKDWPQWGGSDGKNMVADERGLPAAFTPGEKSPQGGSIDPATTKNVAWATRVGMNTLSTPAIVGGRAFLGTCDEKEGYFRCFDLSNGKLVWEYFAPHRDYPKHIDGDWPFNMGRFAPSLGICSSPAVDEGRVFFVNHRCEVICADVRGDGAGKAKVLWTYDFWKELGVRPSDAANGSPQVDGDFLYVPTSNGVDREVRVPYADDRKTPAPDAPNMIVLDKRTGRLLATDDVKQIGPAMLHGQWSSTSIGTVNGRKLVFLGGGDGKCYAFETLDKMPSQPVKLKTAWEFDCDPPEYKSFGGMTWAVHYSLGDKRLKTSINKVNDGTFVGMSEIIATPVFYKNRVYVAIGRDPEHGRGRGALWCIDAAGSGDITKSGRVWSYQGLDRTLSTVSIADGLLFVADVAGRVHCLDADTGKCHWVHETNAETWSSTLVADGKVYLGTKKNLVVLAADRSAPKELARINLGSPMWAAPVAVDGTLYITSTRYLWAVRQGL